MQFFLKKKNPDPTLLSAEVRFHAAAFVSTDFLYDGSCLSCVHQKKFKVVTIVTKFNLILIKLIVRLVGIISVHEGILCF